MSAGAALAPAERGTTVRAVVVAAATSAREGLADRGALLVSLGFYAIIVVTMASLWRTATEATGGAVAGYDARALTWYLTCTEAVTIGLRLRLIETLADDVAGGTVAAEMLRPVPVLAVRLATEVGRAWPRVALCLGVGAVVATVLAGPPPAPVALLLAGPALALAAVANLAAQHAVGAVAFWLRDARSTWFLYQKAYFILGGMLLPLEVLPGRVAAVARVLPFPAMAYVPGRLASGHVEPALLVGQLAWTVALVAVAAVAFGAGLRRLQAVGG